MIYLIGCMLGIVLIFTEIYFLIFEGSFKPIEFILSVGLTLYFGNKFLESLTPPSAGEKDRG